MSLNGNLKKSTIMNFTCKKIIKRISPIKIACTGNFKKFYFGTDSEKGSHLVLDMKKIKALAKDAKKNEVFIQTTNTLSEDVVSKVMEKIQEKLSLDTIEHAYILVAGLMQRGGSNQKAGNSVQFSYDDKTLSSQEFNKILTSVQKGATNRQFARTINRDIINIAIEFEITGDLHNQMKLEHPNLTIVESAWCSNFQTQNPECPQNVREWLVENYKSRFNR